MTRVTRNSNRRKSDETPEKGDGREARSRSRATRASAALTGNEDNSEDLRTSSSRKKPAPAALAKDSATTTESKAKSSEEVERSGARYRTPSRSRKTKAQSVVKDEFMDEPTVAHRAKITESEAKSSEMMEGRVSRSRSRVNKARLVFDEDSSEMDGTSSSGKIAETPSAVKKLQERTDSKTASKIETKRSGSTAATPSCSLKTKTQSVFDEDSMDGFETASSSTKTKDTSSKSRSSSSKSQEFPRDNSLKDVGTSSSQKETDPAPLDVVPPKVIQGNQRSEKVIEKRSTSSHINKKKEAAGHTSSATPGTRLPMSKLVSMTPTLKPSVFGPAYDAYAKKIWGEHPNSISPITEEEKERAKKEKEEKAKERRMMQQRQMDSTPRQKKPTPRQLRQKQDRQIMSDLFREFNVGKSNRTSQKERATVNRQTPSSSNAGVSINTPNPAPRRQMSRIRIGEALNMEYRRTTKAEARKWTVDDLMRGLASLKLTGRQKLDELLPQILQALNSRPAASGASSSKETQPSQISQVQQKSNVPIHMKSTEAQNPVKPNQQSSRPVFSELSPLNTPVNLQDTPAVPDVRIAQGLDPKDLMTPTNKKILKPAPSDLRDSVSAKENKVERRASTRKSMTKPIYRNEQESENEEADFDKDSEYEEASSSSRRKLNSKEELQKAKDREEKKHKREEVRKHKEWEKEYHRTERAMRQRANARMKENDRIERANRKEAEREHKSNGRMYARHLQRIKRDTVSKKQFLENRKKAMMQNIKNLRLTPDTNINDEISVQVEEDGIISNFTDVLPFNSPYFSQLVYAFRNPFNNTKVIRKFVKDACELEQKCYLSNIRDPYFAARFYRGHFMTGLLGSNGNCDYGLSYSYALDGDDDLRIIEDRWTAEVQYGLLCMFENVFVQDGVVEFTKKMEIEALGKVKIVWDRRTFNDEVIADRMRKMTHFVHKFLLIINMWKRRHPNTKHLRVVRYFFHIMEVLVVPVPLDGQEPIYQDVLPSDKKFRYTLVRDMLFWLPAHVGDLTDKVHCLRQEFYDLARQLFAVILDEWDLVMGVTIEEAGFLNRLRLASMRLECFHSQSTKPIVDMLPYCKPMDIRGVTGKQMNILSQYSVKPITWSRSSTLKDASYCQSNKNSGSVKPRCIRPECAEALSHTVLVDHLPHCTPADYRSGFGYETAGRSRKDAQKLEEDEFLRPIRRSRSCFTRFKCDKYNIKELSAAQKSRASYWKRFLEDRDCRRPLVDVYGNVSRAHVERITSQYVPYHFERPDSD